MDNLGQGYGNVSAFGFSFSPAFLFQILDPTVFVKRRKNLKKTFTILNYTNTKIFTVLLSMYTLYAIENRIQGSVYRCEEEFKF